MIVKNPHIAVSTISPVPQISMPFSNSFSNPITDAKDSFNTAIEKWEQFQLEWLQFKASFLYWINPLNWFIEINKGLRWLIEHPETGFYLMAATIIGIMLSWANFKFHKPYIFWGWVAYWILFIAYSVT